MTDSRAWIEVNEPSIHGDLTVRTPTPGPAQLVLHQGQDRSTALLIAAAPDLLAACEAALAYMVDDSRSPRRRAANIRGLRTIIAMLTAPRPDCEEGSSRGGCE